MCGGQQPADHRHKGPGGSSARRPVSIVAMGQARPAPRPVTRKPAQAMSPMDLPPRGPRFISRDPRPAGGWGSLDWRPIVARPGGDEQQPAMPRVWPACVAQALSCCLDGTRDPERPGSLGGVRSRPDRLLRRRSRTRQPASCRKPRGVEQDATDAALEALAPGRTWVGASAQLRCVAR
jgi:hypothetical protein